MAPKRSSNPGNHHVPRKKSATTLLLALACGATVESAARQAGLSGRTVYRRLQDPDFRRQINDLRSEMVERTAAALTAASGEAVKTLLELQKPSYPPAVRLGAARAILEIGTKLREMVELETRIKALEERYDGSEIAA